MIQIAIGIMLQFLSGFCGGRQFCASLPAGRQGNRQIL